MNHTINKAFLGYKKKLQNHHFFLFTLLAIAFCLYTYVSYFVFYNYPYSMDEYNYLTQATIFSRGNLTAAVKDLPTALRDQYMIWHDGKSFTKYGPGFPLLLSLGVKVHLEGFINPLISTLSLYFLFELLTLLIANSAIALLTVSIVAINPYYVGYASSYFAQPTSFLITALIFLYLRKWQLSEEHKYLTYLAFTTCYGILTRPLDSLCAFIPCLIAIFRVETSYARPLRAVRVLSPIIILLCLFCTYNYYLSGQFSVTPYDVFHSDFRIYPPQKITTTTDLSLVGLNYMNWLNQFSIPLFFDYFLSYMLAYIPLASLAGLFFGECPKTWNWMLFLHFNLLYFLYNFHGALGWPQYGARYYYPGFLSLAILASFLWNRINSYFKISPLLKHGLNSLAVLIIITSQSLHLYSLLKLYHERFLFFKSTHEEIEMHCSRYSIVVLHSAKMNSVEYLSFTNWRDLKRNTLRNDDRKIVIDELEYRDTQPSFPNYTRCDYPL